LPLSITVEVMLTVLVCGKSVHVWYIQ